MTKARDLANAGTALTTVSATELGYLDGVTSAVQTQIDSKIGSSAAINPTVVDAKGDIIAATAADTVTRLAAGANNTVLTADSSTATGLKWAAPASGMTLITRQTFSNVSSQAFDNVFTSSYYNYFVVIDEIYAATVGDDLQMQLRYAGPTTQTASYYGSTYSINYLAAASGLATNNASQFTISNQTGSSTTYGSGHFYINSVGNSSLVPSWRGHYVDADANQMTFGGQVNVARTYTGFLLKASGSNITGAVSIYGLAKA